MKQTFDDFFRSVRSGYEGRAGMAAIVLKQDLELDGKKLYERLLKALPSYAWPRFLRIQVSSTGVFTSLFRMRGHFSSFPLCLFPDKRGRHGHLQAAEAETGPRWF